MPAASALAAARLSRDSHRCGWPPVASSTLRMMRTAVVSTALIFGGLRRFGAVLFGIGAFREQAQRGLKQLPVQFRTVPSGPLIRVQSFSTIPGGLSVPSA